MGGQTRNEIKPFLAAAVAAAVLQHGGLARIVAKNYPVANFISNKFLGNLN